MNLENIFLDIKQSFNGLWRTKQRGNSLEIITPYATTNNRFVSVFLTKQGGDYIVSDGGWLDEGIYDCVLNNDEQCYNKLLIHYQSSFNISELSSKDGKTYFYLKCSNIIDIPSNVLDISVFVQSVVSFSQISFESKVENDSRARFVSKANNYLKTFIDSESIKFNSFLDSNKKELKFNALFYNSPNRVTLINYISGSTNSYFSNSIFRSNTLFEMADESIAKDFIDKKVSIIDNQAKGYSPKKLAHYLVHLEKQTGTNIVNWSERECLQAILK